MKLDWNSTSKAEPWNMEDLEQETLQVNKEVAVSDLKLATVMQAKVSRGA